MLILILSVLVIVTSITTLLYRGEVNMMYSNEAIKFYAIQNAQSGSISEINSSSHS